VPLRRDEVLVSLQRVPEVAYGAEVVADKLIEPVALVAVDRRGDAGHGAPPLGQGTENATRMRPSKYFGEYRLSCIEGSFFGAGPGAF
jgi:hypothetical protein